MSAEGEYAEGAISAVGRIEEAIETLKEVTLAGNPPMNRRDLFAVWALNGLIAGSHAGDLRDAQEQSRIVILAYKLADIMETERPVFAD